MLAVKVRTYHTVCVLNKLKLDFRKQMINDFKTVQAISKLFKSFHDVSIDRKEQNPQISISIHI